MIIRDFLPGDWRQIEELYEQQAFDYRLPPPEAFIEHLVAEHEGRIVMALGARPTVEAYMFADKNWQETPGMKKELFSQLHEVMRRRLLRRGIMDAHAFLPPQIAKSWGRRLTRCYGWVLSTWTCYVGFSER